MSESLKQALNRQRQAGQALLATNFYNAETLLAVLRAAQRAGSALILQTSPSTISYLGLRTAAAMARAAARELGVQAWLHLDHARDIGLIARCIEAGYDSVMVDASSEPFEENVRVTREVVSLARAHGVLVEAELGYIPKLGEREAEQFEMTSPEQAESFVAETGADLLAVAIGNAHGFYQREPRLDMDRLTAIRQQTGAFLVLHGASGIPDEQWRQAVRGGIVKVNFATEIKDTLMVHLRTALQSSDSIDLRTVFPPAMDAVTQLVLSKLALCAGQENAPHSMK